MDRFHTGPMDLFCEHLRELVVLAGRQNATVVRQNATVVDSSGNAPHE